jgi:hypothetical protein
VSFSREEIKTIVREVLAEIFVSASQPQPQPAEEWVDLRSAWKTLGYPSYNSLYKAVQSGLLREGKEVCDRRLPGAKIARWQIDLVATRKRLRETGGNRRTV